MPTKAGKLGNLDLVPGRCVGMDGNNGVSPGKAEVVLVLKLVLSPCSSGWNCVPPEKIGL